MFSPNVVVTVAAKLIRTVDAVGDVVGDVVVVVPVPVPLIFCPM
jgi:hypothetical protein